MTTADNAEIDAVVMEIIREARHGVASLAIGAVLARRLDGRLRPAGQHARTPLTNACEHANRACQRLRRQGKVAFDTRDGWLSVLL